VPALVQQLRADGISCEVIFLQTDNKVLLSRFSETRRKHPLTDRDTGLEEAIAKERALLAPIIKHRRARNRHDEHDRVTSSASRSANVSRRARRARYRS